MVVATGAAIGHRQKGGPDGVGDVVQNLLPALGQHARVALVRIVTIEGGGDAGPGIVGKEFIAG